MSVQEIKKELASLTPAEQGEVTAYLFRLRHANDPEYQATVQRRMDDKDAAHWLTLNEVEKRLDQN